MVAMVMKPEGPQPSEESWPAPMEGLPWRELPTLGLTIVTCGCIYWLVLVFMAMVLVVTPWDFAKFYHSGYAHLRGEDLYTWYPSTPGPAGTWGAALDGEIHTLELSNLNPPHFHLLVLPLALLPLEAAYVVWMAVGLVCLIVGLWLTVCEVGGTWSPGERQLALIALLASVDTTSMIRLGQLTWLLLLPVVLMWRAARQERWWSCGLWLGLLVASKVFFLIFVPYLLLTRRWSALLGAFASCLLWTAAGVAVFGLDSYRNWMSLLGASASWGWDMQNAGLWGLLTRSLTANVMFEPVLMLGPATVKLIWLVLAGGLGLVMLVVACRDRSQPGLDRAFALLLASALLLSPLGWNYYFLLPVPPLLALLMRWKQEGRVTRGCHWLLLLALPGLFWPISWTFAGQPSALLTLTIGSVYFWTLLCVWLALVVDGWTPGEPETSTPGATSVGSNLISGE